MKMKPRKHRVKAKTTTGHSDGFSEATPKPKQ